jgi:hypothetical protein
VPITVIISINDSALIDDDTRAQLAPLQTVVGTGLPVHEDHELNFQAPTFDSPRRALLYKNQSLAAPFASMYPPPSQKCNSSTR